MRLQQRVLLHACQGTDQQPSEVTARVDRFQGSVRRPRTLRRPVDGFLWVSGEEHGHRCESHQRTVSCGSGMVRSREGVTRSVEPHERVERGIADVEAIARGRKVALVVPAHVASHLVRSVESTALDQALREAERHRCVVRPLAGFQTEGTSAHHIFDGFETSDGTRAWFPVRRRPPGPAGSRDIGRASLAAASGHGHRARVAGILCRGVVPPCWSGSSYLLLLILRLVPTRRQYVVSPVLQCLTAF